jgi:4-hydroxybenzoyl-CoA thioesterase
MKSTTGKDQESAPMLVNRKVIHIEWGHCDPAGIVYYPRYLEYFDNCTAALFEQAGLPKYEMLKTYGIAGIAMVDMRVRFLAPSRFGEDVTIESSIPRWRNSSFDVHHKLLKAAVLAVECFETRVWAVYSAEDPGKLQSKPVPREIIDRFSTPAEPTA